MIPFLQTDAYLKLARFPFYAVGKWSLEFSMLKEWMKLCVSYFKNSYLQNNQNSTCHTWPILSWLLNYFSSSKHILQNVQTWLFAKFFHKMWRYLLFPSGSYELFQYESLNCCHIYFFISQNMHVLLQNVQVHIEKFVINDQLWFLS